jgi:hypothetical protein
MIPDVDPAATVIRNHCTSRISWGGGAAEWIAEIPISRYDCREWRSRSRQAIGLGEMYEYHLLRLRFRIGSCRYGR